MASLNFAAIEREVQIVCGDINEWLKYTDDRGQGYQGDTTGLGPGDRAVWDNIHKLWVGLAAYRETCERATTLAWTWFRPPVFPTMVIICERTLQKFPIAILESNLDSIALNSLSFALAHEMLHTQLLGLRMKTFTYMYWISGHLY